MKDHVASKCQKWELDIVGPTSEPMFLTAMLLCPSREEGRSSMGVDHMVSDLGPEGKVGKDTGQRKGK